MPVLTLLARSGWPGWYHCWETDWLQAPSLSLVDSLPPRAGYICTAVIMRRDWSLDCSQLIGALHVFEALTLPSMVWAERAWAAPTCSWLPRNEVPYFFHTLALDSSESSFRTPAP